MKKLYVCPHCQSEDVQIDGYEDGGGDYGEDLTPVFICNDCGYGFSEDEGFWGYECEPDEKPEPEGRISGNPDLWEVSGGYDQ